MSLLVVSKFLRCSALVVAAVCCRVSCLLVLLRLFDRVSTAVLGRGRNRVSLQPLVASAQACPVLRRTAARVKQFA